MRTVIVNMLRLMLGEAIFSAGLLKALSMWEFADNIYAMIGLPKSIIAFAAISIVSIEITVGGLILINYLVRPALVVVVVLLIIFISVLIAEGLNGSYVSCGCFGRVGDSYSAGSPLFAVLKNIIMTIVAGFLYRSSG